MTFRAVSAVLCCLVLAACFPSASKAILRDEDLAILKPDTKETCLVAAQVQNMGLGALQGGVKLATTAGEMVTAGATGSILTNAAEGFTFVNVPKGPFRVTYLNFHHATTKEGHAVNEFDTSGNTTHFIGNHSIGAVPNELSGTCKGGFVWLGVFRGKEGGLFSESKLYQTSDSISAGYALRDLKAKLAGSPWAAEVSDSPADNTPLPAGQAVVEIVDPAKAAAEAAAAKAAGEAAMKKMMSESRPVTQPPSDAGAAAAGAGTYVLEAVNGKPVPYTFEANKCIMLNAQIELKADGAYTTGSNLDCAGAKYSFPTSGLFGVQGGAVTFATAVGPAAAPGSVTTRLEGPTLTMVAGPDTYTYKKH